MEAPGVERRLAAILAADMVGYSGLMEADEKGTLARLRTHRLELIDPAIAKTLFQRYCGVPAQQLLSPGYVRPPHLRVILWQGFVNDLAGRSGEAGCGTQQRGGNFEHDQCICQPL